MSRKSELTKEQIKAAALTAIYVLKGPDGRIRYVGKAKNPALRLQQHKTPGRTSITPIAAWCRKLKSRGAVPVMEIIEWTGDWENAERRWISYYRSLGPLLNLAAGGMDGAHLQGERARFDAYRWIMLFCSRIQNDSLRDSIKATANRIKAQHGLEGMRSYNAHLKQVIGDAAPLVRV